MAAMNQWTDSAWRHVRIEQVRKNRFAVRTWYLNNSFDQTAKAFLGVPGDVNLERLSLDDAREWGAKIEARLAEPGERIRKQAILEGVKELNKDELF